MVGSTAPRRNRGGVKREAHPESRGTWRDDDEYEVGRAASREQRWLATKKRSATWKWEMVSDGL